MSDQYGSAAGFVQFDPKEATANNKPVRYIRIRAVGSQKMVDVTVWDQFKDVSIAKGDFIAADGQFSTRNVNEKTFYNLSAKTFINFGSGLGKPVGVVNAPVAPGHDDGEPF